MTRFTDSPYESMMQQKPYSRRAADVPPSFPPGHPCHNCSYGKNGPCLGICYRELLQKKEGKKCGL